MADEPLALSSGGERTQLESAVVRRVRESLRESYPRANVREVLAIAREAGINSLPAPLMLAGSLDDRSPEGMAARLEQAADPVRGWARDPHVLFSTAFYDIVQPGVRAAGLSPWLHYNVYGVGEQKSPHFLLDPDYLRQALPESVGASLIDDYLGDPANWFLSPSPYVNVEMFLLSGEWDHRTQPLVQILASNTHWLQPRLMMVDSAWGGTGESLINGVGYLLSTAGPLASGAVVRTWLTVEQMPHSSGPGSATVVPGFSLSLDPQWMLPLSNAASSADRTMLRLPTHHVALVSGPNFAAQRLVVVGSELDADAVAELVTGVREGDCIAPFSRAQELAIRRLVRLVDARATVLDWGRQCTVTFLSFERLEALSATPRRWDPSTGITEASEQVTIVLSRDAAELVDAPQVAALIDGGAQLCLLERDAGDAEVWARTLHRARAVVVELAVLELVLPLVASSVVRVIDTAGVRRYAR